MIRIKKLILVIFIVGCQKQTDAPLFYKVVGHSESKIVFLHGLLGSSNYWDQVAPQLSLKHQLVMLDLLGFGDSPKPDSDYTVAEHVSRIDEVIKISIEKSPFVLVGHSMGTFLALDYTIEHPNQVQKLILINAPMVTDEEGMKAAVAESSSKFMVQITFDKTWGRIACAMHEIFPFISYPIIRFLEPDLPPAVAKAAGQHSWHSYSGSFKHVLLEQNFFELLSKVTNVPVLIITSDKDKYTNPAVFENRLQQKNVKVVQLAGDHNILLHQPEEISAQIDQFISH